MKREVVMNTRNAFDSFMNPFEIEGTDQLYNISSGAPVSKEIEHDILRAETAGKDKRVKFEARLETKKDFFEPIKRLNLKTMADKNKTIVVRSKKNKEI